MKRVFYIVIAMTLAAVTSQAATWTVGDMNWTEPDSDSFSPAYSIGSSVDFTTTNAGAVAVTNSGVSPGAVNILSGSYIFSGGGIGGSGPLTMSSSGTLTLSSTNTYTGGTTVSGGQLVLDGGVVSNSSTISVAGGGGSLVLTNGARFFTGGGILYVGRSTSGNSLIVAGGSGTSTFNGGGQEIHAGDPRSTTDNNNQLVVVAGGVITNVSNLTIAESSEYQTSHCYYNSGTVINGGNVYLSGDLRVGYCDPAGQDMGNSISNTMLIANGGVVRAGGSAFVGVVRLNAGNSGGSQSFNSMTITNGGQLYSGGVTSYIGRTVSATYPNAKANGNTVTIAGSLNGTNALWDVGGKPLAVGFTTTSIATGNVLAVNASGVATNISSLTVSAANTLALGAGGQVFATAVINAGTMIVTLDNSVTPACGKLTVSGNLDVTNATLNIVTNRISYVPYVIASYGTLQGSFRATNGLPSAFVLSTNYQMNSIALLPPPAGTVITLR